MTQIAFLGTGLLGSALAEAAAKRGDTVTVWNRSIDKARKLETFGLKVAPTPADAVRGAARVHLVLKDDAVVEEVIAALRPGLGADTVICDHTTAQPKLTAARSRRLNAEGVRYLHCPVFIGPPAARQAQGTILVSGPQAHYDAVKADLARMAAKVQYFGERPDLSAVFKLCGNAFIIGMNALVADVFAIGSASGVEPAEALKVVELFNPSATITGRGRSMADGDFTPNFELNMARKDLRLMLETAGDTPLAALPCVAKRMDELIAKGHGEQDACVLGVESRAVRAQH